MSQTYRTLLKWTLYAGLFLLAMMAQTVVLASVRVGGSKLSLVPVCVACVACREEHEAGGLYALCCAAVWALSGEASGAAYLLLLPVAALLGAYLSGTYFTRGLLPCLAACAMALCLCEGGVYLQRLYLGAAMPPQAPAQLAFGLAASLLTAPLWWALARAIHRVGGQYGT